MAVSAKAPCRADAERAAALLVSAGVSRVMLFGSVARGEAMEDSDIDLVAIYDDLDYADRFARKRELSRLAGTAVEHPVDVLVTDRPEWKVRTEKVPTSLESRVAHYGLVLADEGAGEVDWDKEMVMPTDGYEATVRRLREVSSALRSLKLYLRPDDDEEEARASGDWDEALYLQVIRFEGACGQVQRAVESAIKALVHTAGRRRELRGHDIGELCAKLVEPYRSDVSVRLSLVGADELTRWHEDSRYTPDQPVEPPRSEQVRTLVEVACKVASYTVEQLDESVHEAYRVQRAATSVEGRLNSYDLETGSPLS